uniref:hypothetical protein n=1 Tax=Nocardia wallacei TaxID=480035 RepID=UPI002456F772
MPSPHVVTAPAVTPAAPPARTGWETLSDAMTTAAVPIAARNDLTVIIAPGAAAGDLALFLHAPALIAIEGATLGIDPATARPWRHADRYRYAPTWGALTHECAHAAHTRWRSPQGTDPEIAGAATLLEESRIEAAQLRRRPEDRHWLRACTHVLVFDDLGSAQAAAQLAPTRHAAAHAAALMLARIDAGVLDADECATAAAAIEDVLGRDLLRQLRTLWRIAHRLSDTNTTGMLELGRRWHALVGPEPHTTPQPNSPLGAAVTGTLDDIAAEVASHQLPPDPADEAEQQRHDEARERARAAAAAAKVFGNRPRGRVRAPSDRERSAARVLARALNTASQRERAVTTKTSALPPGRLRMRGALAREAQRAARAIPPAQPITPPLTHPRPVPPVRVGVAGGGSY